jgi:hypothetical protein
MNGSLEQGEIIKNYKDTVSHGQKRVREDALKIIEAGIKGGDPGVGTRKQVRVVAHTLHVAGGTDKTWLTGSG